MARFDDFTLAELREIHEAADGWESWYGEMYEALERRAALDGVTWPPVRPAAPVVPLWGVQDVVINLDRARELEVTFADDPATTIRHNWGL